MESGPGSYSTPIRAKSSGAAGSMATGKRHEPGGSGGRDRAGCRGPGVPPPDKRLGAYFQTEEGRRYQGQDDEIIARYSGFRLWGQTESEAKERMKMYEPHDPMRGIGRAAADSLSKRYRENPAAYAAHVQEVTQDPRPALDAVDEAVLKAMSPVTTRLRREGMTPGAALDAALRTLPGIYSWRD